MRRLLALLAAALCVAAFVTSQAAAVGYTCNLRVDSVTIQLHGTDNSASVCRAFNSSWEGRPVATHPGRLYGSWTSRIMDIRISVWSTSAWYGRTMTRLLAPKVQAEWRRTY